MLFNPSSQLSKKLTRLIPQIQQIVCARFTNFLTINTSSDNSWSHSGKLLHEEHMEAVGFLQANFKNHIVNRQAIENIKQLQYFLEQSGNFEILQNLFPQKEKIAEKHRKQFFIFDPTFSIDQMMECQLVKNKSFNKIICFPKANPLQLNTQFEKFCLYVPHFLFQHNVRAIGLTDFTLKSLMNQICKISKNPTLIHEIIHNDLTIYKEKSEKLAISELIIFLNKLKEEKIKNVHNFINFKQIAVFLRQDREITCFDKLLIRAPGPQQIVSKFVDFSIQSSLKEWQKQFIFRNQPWTVRKSDVFLTQLISLYFEEYLIFFQLKLPISIDNATKLPYCFLLTEFEQEVRNILPEELNPYRGCCIFLSNIKLSSISSSSISRFTSPTSAWNDSEYPSLFLSLHPLFDEWKEVMSQCIFSRNALREGDTLYLKINVSRQFTDYLKKIQTPFEQSQVDQSVKQIFKLKSNYSQKRICWLSCSTSLVNKKMFTPGINTHAIFLGQTYNNQIYDIFAILKGQIPTVEQLLTYDTLIIPGSGLSVLDRHQNIEKLVKNINEAYQKSEKLKILGICYGHQLMAQLFGAKVVKRQRKAGLELIRFNKQVIGKFSFLQPLKTYNEPNINLSEHHEDNVTTVPKGFIQLAVSNSCENQALVSQNGRIFSFQFHPEYNYSFAKGYTARCNVYYKDSMQGKPVYNHSKNTLGDHFKACEAIRRCIMEFI